MSKKDYRDKLAIFIIIANIGLFVVILILYTLGGFTDDELDDLLKCLIPVKSLYVAGAARYIFRPSTEKASARQAERPQYKFLVVFLVRLHVFILYALVILYALGGRGFDFLSNLITIVEAGFNTVIATIVTGIFTKQQAAVQKNPHAV